MRYCGPLFPLSETEAATLITWQRAGRTFTENEVWSLVMDMRSKTKRVKPLAKKYKAALAAIKASGIELTAEEAELVVANLKAGRPTFWKPFTPRVMQVTERQVKSVPMPKVNPILPPVPETPPSAAPAINSSRMAPIIEVIITKEVPTEQITEPEPVVEAPKAKPIVPPSNVIKYRAPLPPKLEVVEAEPVDEEVSIEELTRAVEAMAFVEPIKVETPKPVVPKGPVTIKYGAKPALVVSQPKPEEIEPTVRPDVLARYLGELERNDGVKFGLARPRDWQSFTKWATNYRNGWYAHDLPEIERRLIGESFLNAAK